MAGAGGAEAEHIVAEGWLRKKKNRVHLWDQRYFVLAASPPRLVYYIKHPETGATPRGTFDLTDGCFVTDVEELNRGKGKKPLYVFWVVWPELPKLGSSAEADTPVNGAAEGKAEEADAQDAADDDCVCEDGEENEQRKTLKKLVHDENNAFKATQQRAEQQIEKHQNYDSYLKNGAKVAAVGAGAVVVGAFTAGIGLIPYVTVLGLAAIAAGGGGVAVAYGYRRPPNSRLVLATESLATALKWKDALDDQIGTLEVKKAVPPEQVSFKFASEILADKTSWSVVATYEGMRVLECGGLAPENSASQRQVKPATEIPRHLMPLYTSTWFRTYKICRKAQLRIPAPPESAFLSLMENRTPFLREYLEDVTVVQQIDDHSDVMHLKPKLWPTFGKLGLAHHVDLVVMRFWCLEEDGTYVISMNSVDHEACPKTKGTRRVEIQGVITIAPRLDTETQKDALVTCACEISNIDAWARFVGLDAWLVDGILRQLVELRSHVQENRYVRRQGRRAKRRPSARSLQSKGSQRAYETHSSAGESDLAPEVAPVPEATGRRRFLRRRSREDPQQAEIVYLRDTIMDREQQVARLEKRIKKEGKKQQQSQQANGASRAQDLQDLLIHMQELLEEVDALKAAYAKVAGSPYEPKKSFFSSSRRLPDQAAIQSQAAADRQLLAVDSASPPAIVLPGVTMEPIAAQDEAGLIRRPSAWRLNVGLEDDDNDNDDEVKQQVHAIQDRGFKNAMLVALFVACLSLTMLLTAYLERGVFVFSEWLPAIRN